MPQIEYILNQKALDVNKLDENGRSALHVAAMNGKNDLKRTIY